MNNEQVSAEASPIKNFLFACLPFSNEIHVHFRLSRLTRNRFVNDRNLRVAVAAPGCFNYTQINYQARGRIKSPQDNLQNFNSTRNQLLAAILEFPDQSLLPMQPRDCCLLLAGRWVTVRLSKYMKFDWLRTWSFHFTAFNALVRNSFRFENNRDEKSLAFPRQVSLYQVSRFCSQPSNLPSVDDFLRTEWASLVFKKKIGRTL